VSFTHRLARIPVPHALAVSPDGSLVARLVRRGADLVVEARALDTGPAERVWADDPLLTSKSTLCIPSAGRIWIRTGWPGCFRVMEARPSGPDGGWRTETIAESGAFSLHLLPGREGSGWDVMIASTQDGESTIWLLERDPMCSHRLMRLEGLVSGGIWLEPPRTMAVNLHQPGCPPSGFLVDLAAGSHRRLFHVSDHSKDTIEGCDPSSGLLWVTTDYSGYRRVGVADLQGAGKVRFLADPPGEERAVSPVGQSGRHLVLARQRGVATELWLGDPDDLSVSGPLRIPHGSVDGPVVVSGDRLRFAFSGPTVPVVCAAYLPSRDTFRLEEPPDLGTLDSSELVAAEVTWINGRKGGVETLVYEPPGDRQRGLIVVALHGGPVAQWSAAFTPDLQLFAGLGAVVAAPNYHGSTGYGEEFVRALEHAAGTVELDDVIAVIRAMRQRTGLEDAPVVLYGHSYGAFLALLAAATHPHLCDGVIAHAPFTSLASLGAAGMPHVRRLTDLLQDPSLGGEPDLLRRCGSLRAKLLIAHGTEDHAVPITESEALCNRLRACGYRDGHDLWFLPFPGEGHAIGDPALGDPTELQRLYDQIEVFIAEILAGPRRAGSTRIPYNRPVVEEQDVAGRRPRSSAPVPRPLCDTIPKGGDT
jgi:pimeloyl-ACP methyl ester carboxylesterase